MYDGKCEELAKYFLEGSNSQQPIDVAAKDLAETIQDAVENWFTGQAVANQKLCTTCKKRPVYQLIAEHELCRECYTAWDLQKDNISLRAAAKLALHEMCNTIAPRDSFTDAADALDAAIVKTNATLTKRCQQRHPEGGQCEFRAGHTDKHLAGIIM